MLSKWQNLPDNLKNESVKKYYDALNRKRFELKIKRLFDIFFSLVLIIILLPIFLVLSLIIVLDSGVPVFYLQSRVTKNLKNFNIIKFRTMVNNADKIGSLVTTDNDCRITRIGKLLRKFRLDELPQLFNILGGSMSFVGTRPEVQKYVDAYNSEMLATLLLPAGVTSTASIEYKDEAELLRASVNVDETYINEILPQKMKYNLEYLENFSLKTDLKIIFNTVFAVFK